MIACSNCLKLGAGEDKLGFLIVIIFCVPGEDWGKVKGCSG